MAPLFFSIAVTLLLAAHVSSENILFFHGVSSYSHRVQTWPIAEALVERGHNVSYIAPYYSKQPNSKISELVPKSFAENNANFIAAEFDVNIRVRNEMPPMLNSVFEFAYGSCKLLLAAPEFQEWLKEQKKIDLFIVDNAFPECGIGLAHKMGAKYIVFSTVAVIAHEYDAIGFLPESSSIPELETYPPDAPLGFLDRVSNTLLTLRWRSTHYEYISWMNDLLRRELSIPNMPNMDDLYRNVGLVFSTGNPVVDYPRSLPPLYVDVSGIHCKDSVAPLPKKILSFVNSNKTGETNDGFIYISLGSVVVSSNLPENIKNVFFDVVRTFPNLKFLWKWEGEMPRASEIPTNIMLEKWFPQMDILAHTKIRGFITQGGRPSALEALYNSVPMITFPVLGDQDLNAQRMTETGANIRLELGTLKFDDLRDAVERVAYDPSVKKRMEKLQSIFRDRPMAPLQTALWWTDYVLRNEDTAHLQPYGNYQYWFVRRQVDVWVFLTVAVLSAAIAAVVIGQKLIHSFAEDRSVKKKVA